MPTCRATGSRGRRPIGADDLLRAKDSAIAASSNITFFALTATPKAKTLRLFGTERDGRWEAFDTYTMAQAIKEGFILQGRTRDRVRTEGSGSC